MKSGSKEKVLFIIAGANGSGKTIFARPFAGEKNLSFLNMDDIAISYNPTNPEKVKIKAGKIFLKKFIESVKKGKSFIVETTLSGKYLRKLIEETKNKGFLIVIIYIFLESVELCIKRVRHRVLSGGHDIKIQDIGRRYFRGKKLFMKTYKNMADICYLIYNGDDDFEEVAIFVKDKEIVLNEIIYKKFMEVIDG